MKETWSATCQYHDENENYEIKTLIVKAESIGEALSAAAEYLDNEMENNNWSDYISLMI